MKILSPIRNAYSLVIFLLYIGGNQAPEPPFIRAPGSPDKWPFYNKCFNCYQEQNKLRVMHRLITIRNSIPKSLNKTQLTNRTNIITNFDVVTSPPKSNIPTLNLIFSSQVSGKLSDDNVLQFNIYSKGEQSKIVEAYLWLFIKKRQRVPVRAKGRRIIIHVYEINPETGNETLMTSLKTRIKKSQYQKIVLPVQRLSAYTADRISSMTLPDIKKGTKNDVSPSAKATGVNALRLRITCERCGRKIRPMLLYKSRRKKRPSDRLRFLRTRRLNKDKPFLILYRQQA